MSRRTKRLSTPFVVLLVVNLAASSLVSPRASAAFKFLQEGMKAPEVIGRDLRTGDKVEVKSAGDEENAVLLITFWATWSKRSIEILQDLKEMVAEYDGLPFRVVAVNVEGQLVTATTRAHIETMVAELDLPFPVILDEGLKAFYTYGVVAVPSTAILDRDGVLRYDPAGYSYAIRDRLVDSTQVLLGLKSRSDVGPLDKGYAPKKQASRYYHLALQLNQKRKFERALDHLDRSTAADTLFSAPLNLRGQIMLRLGRSEDAAAEFEHAVALDESSVAAWAGWGRALYRSGHQGAAREKLAEALDLDSSYTPALLDQALCLLSEQQTEEALGLLASVRELNPQEPATYLILGRHHEMTGRTAEALTTYRRALEFLYPDR